MIATFKYIEQSTPIHRLDPRTKLVLLLVATFTAASLRDLRLLVPLLALTVVYYSLARLPWRETRGAWSFFFFFIIVLVGVNTLFSGTWSADPNPIVLLQLPFGIAVTWRSLIDAASIMCRMLIGAFMALPITFTIPPTRFGVAFRGLGLNDRLAFAVDLAIRLVPTYAADFRSTIDAQRARGFEVDALRGGIFARFRKLAPLFVPVTMNAILSGDDMTNALDMRSFGLQKRTWLHARRLRFADWLLLGFGTLLLLGSIGWRIVTGGALWVPPYPFG